MNMNVNGHDRYREANPSRVLNNPLVYAQRQQQMQQQQQLQREATRSMAIGEMMERARLAAMNTNNTNNSRSQSPAVGNNPGMSSQFMYAIQRSDQIPIVDSQQKQQRVNQSPSSPLDINASPSSSSGHHPSQSRQNRPARHYPRPPCLNTWQGRGPGRDEFGGMMSDREKQWVVKIQLHQVSQTKDEVSRSLSHSLVDTNVRFRITTFKNGRSKNVTCSKCTATSPIGTINEANTSAIPSCSSSNRSNRRKSRSSNRSTSTSILCFPVGSPSVCLNHRPRRHSATSIRAKRSPTRLH